MRITMKLLTVLRDAAGGGVALPPVIATDAVIGTQLDAGAGYAAYQWQSSSDGATWADISGATAQTYTPTDAVFGLFLRVLGDSAASNATGRVAEVPVQSLGSELIVDGDMEAADTSAYTAFDNAVLTKQTANPHGGARCLRIQRQIPNSASAQQTVMTVGHIYEIGAWGRSDGTSTPVIVFQASGNPVGTTSTNWQHLSRLFRATQTTYYLRTTFGADGNYTEWDDATLKRITPNAQLAAPSADMRLTAYYTLPVSPTAGDQVWVILRSPEGENFFVDGNGWLVLLEYTGSQWNITAYTVASHSRVSRITASSIGATNGVRINMNGTSIALETTADGGDNWTSRGTPASNATYQTATGVNVLHKSAVTPGNLLYEPAV